MRLCAYFPLNMLRIARRTVSARSEHLKVMIRRTVINITKCNPSASELVCSSSGLSSMAAGMRIRLIS